MNKPERAARFLSFVFLAIGLALLLAGCSARRTELQGPKPGKRYRPPPWVRIRLAQK